MTMIDTDKRPVDHVMWYSKKHEMRHEAWYIRYEAWANCRDVYIRLLLVAFSGLLDNLKSNFPEAQVKRILLIKAGVRERLEVGFVSDFKLKKLAKRLNM